jgi:hypothetical protein
MRMVGRTAKKVNQKSSATRMLLQSCVLDFGLLEDGDVGVGVFPKGEEVLVSGERPNAGSVGIRALHGFRLQCIRTSHAQMRQRSRPAVPDDPAVVENLLELGGGFFALPGSKIRLATNVGVIETGNVIRMDMFALQKGQAVIA